MEIRQITEQNPWWEDKEKIKDFNEVVEIVRFSDSLMEGKKYLFFDEITFVNEWQRAVKFVLCNILGSGNLKKELTVQISGLSVNELNEKAKKLLFFFREIEKLFRLYAKCGGFPRSAYELIEKGKIREETQEIYWKWLIGDIAKIERSERITSSVLLGVLKNYGTRFSLNSIAKEMEIGSHVTIRGYLEVLENLFILRNVFPIDLKKGVESFKRMRKVYFIDPFLFHSFKMQLTKTEIKE